MSVLSYNNDSMTENNFWEIIRRCRRFSTVGLDFALAELSNPRSCYKLEVGTLATVILVAKGVKDGLVNPLEIDVQINRQTYVFAPNGDLCRIPALNDNRDHLSLEKMMRLIGTR